MTTDFSTADSRQDQFDPLVRPELFSGVRSRRIFAFFIDVISIFILTTVAAVVIFFLGIFTLGLAWLLYAIMAPAVALLYVAFTLGGPNAATPGMRAMGLEMRLWYGAKPYPLLAAVHVLAFWFSVSLLTPLILLISLFSDRKRLLHDIVLGTVVMNSDANRLQYQQAI
ncbi:RDD domain-containing protein [Roseibium sp. TrichSKD4]|uniref:RDD family protein n=1 Tax=Roseibium sp. TrichSKD4 TaxID=744980 RepID=UPI0001E576AB|nr:RDD family protein [Roseibium sp. TrichSKD4]EFO29486.1 RDD domain-containing protein [Roseibium sp. TrichSKD4]